MIRVSDFCPWLGTQSDLVVSKSTDIKEQIYISFHLTRLSVLYVRFHIGTSFGPYLRGFLVSQHADFVATRLLLFGISAVHFAAFTELLTSSVPTIDASRSLSPPIQPSVRRDFTFLFGDTVHLAFAKCPSLPYSFRYYAVWEQRALLLML